MGLPTPPRKPLWPACPGDPLPIWQFYLIYGCLFPGCAFCLLLRIYLACGPVGRPFYLHHRQPKYASRRSFAGFGCLGTRLLFKTLQSSRGLYKRLVSYRPLGARRDEFFGFSLCLPVKFLKFSPFSFAR